MIVILDVPKDTWHPEGTDPHLGSFHSFTTTVTAKISLNQINAPFELNGKQYPHGGILFRVNGGPLQAASIEEFREMYGDYGSYRK